MQGCVLIPHTQCTHTHLHITSVSVDPVPNTQAPHQMRPRLSPSNQGTMSSKETEWVAQRAGYSSGDGGSDGGMGAKVGRGGD